MLILCFKNNFDLSMFEWIGLVNQFSAFCLIFSKKIFITTFIILGQNRIQNKIPYLKLTWTILCVKSDITFTSSIWSTDSLTTAVLGSIALNYLIKQFKIQKIFWWLDYLKKVYLSNQLRRNHRHICNLHHLCSFRDHCMWW